MKFAHNENFDLTEQLFNDTLVFTTKRTPEKHVAQGVTFVLRHIAEERLFGLKTIWRGSSRVKISDAPRTLVDMLAMPDTGGGIDHVSECIGTYLRSADCDRELLIQYAEQFDNVLYSNASAIWQKHDLMTRNFQKRAERA